MGALLTLSRPPTEQWASSYTKLLAFNLTTHTRLLLLDSDATLLAPLDELFLTPPSRASLPRAYWLPRTQTPMLASHLMLITPSPSSFALIQSAIARAKLGTYDMEIVNRLYGHDCAVLPHRAYALLTGVFRGWGDHANYAGENWDVGQVVQEARYVHFSDDPRPKPWVEASEKEVEAVRPICDLGADGRLDCRGRDFWDWLYEDFRTRRMVSLATAMTYLLFTNNFLCRMFVNVALTNLRIKLRTIGFGIYGDSHSVDPVKAAFCIIEHVNLHCTCTHT